MARLLYRLGRLVAAHSVIVVALWIVLAIGVTLIVGRVGADTDNNLALPGTGSQAATDLLEAGFPPQQNGSNPIIFHVRDGKVTDAANKTAITDSAEAIKKIPYVDSVTSPFDQGGGAQLSKDEQDRVHLGAARHRLERPHRTRRPSACWTPPSPGERPAWRWSAAASIGTVLSPNDTSPAT